MSLWGCLGAISLQHVFRVPSNLQWCNLPAIAPLMFRGYALLCRLQLNEYTGRSLAAWCVCRSKFAWICVGDEFLLFVCGYVCPLVACSSSSSNMFFFFFLQFRFSRQPWPPRNKWLHWSKCCRPWPVSCSMDIDESIWVQRYVLQRCAILLANGVLLCCHDVSDRCVSNNAWTRNPNLDHVSLCVCFCLGQIFMCSNACSLLDWVSGTEVGFLSRSLEHVFNCKPRCDDAFLAAPNDWLGSVFGWEVYLLWCVLRGQISVAPVWCPWLIVYFAWAGGVSDEMQICSTA